MGTAFWMIDFQTMLYRIYLGDKMKEQIFLECQEVHGKLTTAAATTATTEEWRREVIVVHYLTAIKVTNKSLLKRKTLEL